MKFFKWVMLIGFALGIALSLRNAPPPAGEIDARR
jgi:hypothetical protein